MDDKLVTAAERLRAVYTLIAAPVAEGGAGVAPGLQGWDYIESVFPLRDSEFTQVTFSSVSISDV